MPIMSKPLAVKTQRVTCVANTCGNKSFSLSHTHLSSLSLSLSRRCTQMNLTA